MSNRHPNTSMTATEPAASGRRLPEVGVYALALKSIILTHPIQAIATAVVLSVLVTLLYAWVINPVTYYGANFLDLSVVDQRDVVEAMATDALFDESKPRIVAMAARFPNITQLACQMADEELRRGEAMNGLRVERLWLLVYEITGVSECQILRR